MAATLSDSEEAWWSDWPRRRVPGRGKNRSPSKWRFEAFGQAGGLALGTTAPDEVANALDVLDGQDHEAAATLGVGVAGRGDRFLVPPLAMDDRREAFVGVTFHAFPDVNHRAARGVHQDATDLPETFQQARGDAESRQNDHVARLQVLQPDAAGFAARKKAHAHLAQALVDARIMNDLGGQEDAPVGETLARLIGMVDGLVHAVTKTEMIGQAERSPPTVQALPSRLIRSMIAEE